MEDIKSSVEVSQRIEFTCCYVLKEGDVPKLNAHNYKFEATVICPENYENSGRVLSFSEFSKICKDSVPDNCFLYNTESGDAQEQAIAFAYTQYGIEAQPYSGILSAERILNEISLILLDVLKVEHPEVFLKETRLRETTNSFVTWKQEV